MSLGTNCVIKRFTPLFLCLLVSLSPTLLVSNAAEPAPAQWRAVWADGFGGGFKTPEQVDKLIADLKALHFNMVVAQVRRHGDSLYRKSIEPFVQDPAVPPGFDPLDDLVKKAHAAGIQVHAWLNFGTAWRNRGPLAADKKHLIHEHGPNARGDASWLTCNEKGEILYPGAGNYFVDAGHPGVSEHVARVVLELARNYPVDGINFDFIRYPETEGANAENGIGVGYNAVSVARFNRIHNRTGIPARLDPDWCNWRREQVTGVVRRARVELLSLRPEVMLSADLIPWGDGPQDESGWVNSAPYTRVFQNWNAWRREGLLDLTIPMNYDRESRQDHAAFYRHWVDFERANRYRTQLIVGQGYYMPENSLDDSLRQLRYALTPLNQLKPADGICLFNYTSMVRSGRGRSFTALRKALVEGNEKEPPLFPTSVKQPVPDRIEHPTSGFLAGYLKDAAGKPRDGAKITILPTNGSARAYTCTADGNGFFASLFLPPGKYKLQVSEQESLPDCQVEAGKVTWVKGK